VSVVTPFVHAALKAAEQIADTLAKGWRTEYGEHGEIGAGGDRTAGVDRMAEEIFIDHLHPFGVVDSEESGRIGEGDATIVLDPIDGSENALSGLPYFGSSIALQRRGRVEEAVVVNLANGECFYKTGGQTMRGRLRKDDFRPLVARRGATIGIFEKAYADPELALALLRQKRKFRSPGAVALSLAYAHDVDFVIFAGPRRHYDFAAALWMCEDLCRIETEELLIVAKEEETLESLRKLAQER